MRLCRFNDNQLGLVEDDQVWDVSAALEVLPAQRWPANGTDALVGHLAGVRGRIGDIRRAAVSAPLASVILLSPIPHPGKVIGAPVNYQAHLKEAEADRQTFFEHQLKKIHEVGLFLKASSSIVGPSDGIALRQLDRRTDHELELAVIIGKRADRVTRTEALDYVAGYAIGLDITLRGPEERSMRKSIDSYSVLGPWMVTADEIADPGTLDMELRVNGELRQRANTRDLVIDVPGLIAMASSFYTLHPGDVIMTGTPAGVGPIAAGDRLTAWIEAVGSMEVVVRNA